jgi:hypothetical protein
VPAQAQFIWIFMICFPGFLFLTKPVENIGQICFRLSIMFAGWVGWGICWYVDKKSRE